MQFASCQYKGTTMDWYRVMIRGFMIIVFPTDKFTILYEQWIYMFQISSDQRTVKASRTMFKASSLLEVHT